jgi:hypothetical protein
MMRITRSTTAVLAGLFICVSAAALGAQAYAPPVAMSITLPNGESKALQTPESGLATVTVGGRDYGFRPTMHDDEGKRITVTIFDMGNATEAAREVGAVELQGGGPAVASKTTPGFKVQARRATSPNTSNTRQTS